MLQNSAPLSEAGQVPMSLHPSNVEIIDNFNAWKVFVHENYPWLELREHRLGSFQAKVSAYPVGIGSLTTIEAGACEVFRKGRLGETPEAAYLKLIWQFSGSLRIEQDGRDAVIKSGEATVCDTARPYRIQLLEHARFAVLMLPYESCAGWEHLSPKLCATRLDECPTTRAALGAMMGLVSLPYEVADADNKTVVQAVQAMLSSTLHRTATQQGMIAFENPRLSQAQKYVMANISEPSLDANDLASALCMCRRSLYALFKQYKTTPTKMITGIRLDRCRQLLSDAEQGRRKITDIAFESGFSDYATFSRLFKTKFGLTPSQYRQQGGEATQ